MIEIIIKGGHTLVATGESEELLAVMNSAIPEVLETFLEKMDTKIKINLCFKTMNKKEAIAELESMKGFQVVASICEENSSNPAGKFNELIKGFKNFTKKIWLGEINFYFDYNGEMILARNPICNYPNPDHTTPENAINELIRLIQRQGGMTGNEIVCRNNYQKTLQKIRKNKAFRGSSELKSQM